MDEEFFVLDHDTRPRDLSMIDYDAPDDLEPGYYQGEPVRVERPIRLYHHGGRGRRTDLIPGAHPFPVVSQRCRDVCERAGVGHLEFHPVHLIETPAWTVQEGYWLLNVLDNVDALDRDRSAYRLMTATPDLVASIDRLALLPANLRGRDLVRLAEYPLLLLISRRLRDRFEQDGLTGFAFLPPSEYRRLP